MLKAILLLITTTTAETSSKFASHIDLTVNQSLDFTEIRYLLISHLNSKESIGDDDKEMSEYVINAYFDRLAVDEAGWDQPLDSINHFFDEKLIRKEIDKFKENMYNELIRLYGVEINDPFAEKMRKEPLAYGLTFKAFKILNR